jgi:hypothetical protein
MFSYVPRVIMYAALNVLPVGHTCIAEQHRRNAHGVLRQQTSIGAAKHSPDDVTDDFHADGRL